jgi:hypothetical protein
MTESLKSCSLLSLSLTLYREGVKTSVAGDVFISVSKDKSVGLFSLDNMNWCVFVNLGLLSALWSVAHVTLTHACVLQ